MTDPFPLPDREEADAKAWFYLDHRADIEKWVAQRTDAAEVLERFLRALEVPLTEMAATVDAELDRPDPDVAGLQIFGLRRAGWGSGLRVTIEWDPKTLLVPGKDNPWPFTAVRLDDSLTAKGRWQRARTEFELLVKTTEGARSFRHTWPYWRFEKPAAGAAGVAPDALARGLFDSFRVLWDKAAPIVDAVVASDKAALVAGE